MKKCKKSRQGFTLVELVIVLVILAILVGIALPAFMGVRARAYRAEALQIMSEIKTMGWAYRVEHGDQTDSGWFTGFGAWGQLDAADIRALGYPAGTLPQTNNFDFQIHIIGDDGVVVVDRPGECGNPGAFGGCFAIRAVPRAGMPADLAGTDTIWMTMNHDSGIAITYVP